MKTNWKAIGKRAQPIPRNNHCFTHSLENSYLIQHVISWKLAEKLLAA